MNLNLNDLQNLDYCISVAIKSLKKYNEFDEYDVSTTQIKELQCRIQEEISVYEND